MTETNTGKIKSDVINALKSVIDPETGVDVIRMRLVVDLEVQNDGTVAYRFRPSSPLCPIALPLVISVIEMIKKTPGVKNQQVTIVDYVGADALNDILRSLPLSSQTPPPAIDTQNKNA